MKHIETYEKYDNEYWDWEDYPKYWKEEDNRGEMWKLPLKKPDFYICLNKVEMPEDQQNFWKRSLDDGMYQKDIHRNFHPEIKYMILQRSNTGYFTWSRCDKFFHDESNASFIYKGEMKVTDEEVKEYYYQIELKKDANKYNL